MSLIDIFIGDNFEQTIDRTYERAKERRERGESASTFHRCGFTKVNGTWKLFEPSTGKEIIPDYSTGTFTYGDKIV